MMHIDHKYDQISISNVEVHTVIGVYEYERQEPQPIVLDLILYVDRRELHHEDTIETCIDYDPIIDSMKVWIHSQSFNLIETLALQTLKFIFDSQGEVREIALALTKPHARQDAGISVQMRRSRSDLESDLDLI